MALSFKGNDGVLIANLNNSPRVIAGFFVNM